MNPTSLFAKANKFLLRPAGFALGLGLLAGCVVERPAPRRVYVEPAPPAGEVVIVREAPPPPREEFIPLRPGPRYVWCRGHWAYNGHAYYWIPGHWELPPREHAEWIAPRWEVRGGGYVFIEGVWR